MAGWELKEYQRELLDAIGRFCAAVRAAVGNRADHERDASRLKLKEANEALGLYDGGPWIDKQIQKQHLPLTRQMSGFLSPKRQHSEGSPRDLRR